MNRESHEIWVWEFKYWEAASATTNLASAISASLPHQGAVALLQQLRHHAVRENVAGPPGVLGHGISYEISKRRISEPDQEIRFEYENEENIKFGHHIQSYSIYFLNVEKPPGFQLVDS